MKRIQKGLFFLPNNSAAFTFRIFPVESVKDQSVLCDYIELAGGICLDADDNDEEADKYAIPLIDFNWLHEHNIEKFTKPKDDHRDFFMPDYVYDCYTKDQLFDLNSYRIDKLTSPILESVDYDSNKILHHELSWNQLFAQLSKTTKNAKTNSNVTTTNTNTSVPQPRASISVKSLKNNSPSKDKIVHTPTSTIISPIKNAVTKRPSASSSKSPSISSRPQNMNTIEHDASKSIERKIGKKSPDRKTVQVEQQEEESDMEIEEIPVQNNIDDVNGETSKYFSFSTSKQDVLQNQNVKQQTAPKLSIIPTSSASSSSAKPENTKKRESSPHSKAINKTRRLSSGSDSSEPYSLNGTSDFETKTTNKTRPTVPIEQRMKCGRMYTVGESALILKYICQNDLHSLTGGLTMWKEMEAKKVVKGRTYQSLKEHFRKFVLNNLDLLKCSKKDKEKFQEALQHRGGKGGRPPARKRQGKK